MATRSRTTFKKRQKEIARMEWQRDKAAKRLQRKLSPKPPEGEEPEGAAEAGAESDFTSAEPSQHGE